MLLAARTKSLAGPISVSMGDFVVSRAVVPDWQGGGRPARPMADQVADVLEKFDDEKDMRSIVALTQGMRWIDQAHTKDDTIDSKEWQSVSRAMRKALGDPKAPGERAERIIQAFTEEAEKK